MMNYSGAASSNQPGIQKRNKKGPVMVLIKNKCTNETVDLEVSNIKSLWY